MTQTIGIRELRQHASRYVAAAHAGEEILVTDRGLPMARLVPLSPLEQRIDYLVRKHGAHTPADPSIKAWEIEPAPNDGTDTQAILDEGRAERF